MKAPSGEIVKYSKNEMDAHNEWLPEFTSFVQKTRKDLNADDCKKGIDAHDCFIAKAQKAAEKFVQEYEIQDDEKEVTDAFSKLLQRQFGVSVKEKTTK